MDRETKIVMLKLDVIFKRVFGDPNNTDIITAFVAALLEIPRESIENVQISNVELPPDYPEMKFSRLDLKLIVDDRVVNIEIQLNREPEFEARTLFYWAKLYAGELKSGDRYDELSQTICINITNFELFDCEDYHSVFKVMEADRHTVLSDKFAIHFFELRKLGRYRKNKPMDEWLRLINAETEEELMDIMKRTDSSEVKKTVVMLKEMSADEKLREIAYYREKQMHDEATALGHAHREGREEGIAEGLAKGIAKGRSEGMEKGMKEGIAKGREEIVEKMRQSGLSEEQIKAILDK